MLKKIYLFITIFIITNCSNNQYHDVIIDNKGEQYYGIKSAKQYYQAPIKAKKKNTHHNQPVTIEKLPKYTYASNNQSLADIADSNNVDIDELSNINNIDHAASLKHNQRIILPNHILFKTKSGQSIYLLAKKYNVSAKTIASMNNLKPPFTLRANQIIKIPVTRIANINDNVSKNTKLDHQTHDKVPATSVKMQNIPAPITNHAEKLDEDKPIEENISLRSTQKGKPVILSIDEKPAIKIVSDKQNSEKTRFTWPIQGNIIKNFSKDAPKFDGIMLKTKAKSSVKSANEGEVIYAGNGIKEFGNLVIIKHSGKWFSTYGHLGSIKVKKGSQIKSGQVIGITSTNNPKIYFSIRNSQNYVDPEKYLPKK
jgi:lipoprotein NlpD